MAYAINEEDQNKQNQGDGGIAEPPTTAAAPGGGPGAQTKGGAPQSTPAQPFQNLQAYLGANQQQVGEQANNLSGELTNQYNQTQSDIGQGQQDFANQVQAGYTAPNDQLVEQAATNPTDFVSNPNNVTAFNSLYNDTYTGPQNFESTQGYGDLSGKVNKAVTDANLVNSVPGLETYYQSKNPNATKGGSILDSVLLTGTPEAYGQVTNAAKPFGSLSDYLSNAVNTGNRDVSEAQQTAQNTSTAARNRFTGEGGAIPGFENDLNNRVTQAQNEASGRAQGIQTSLKGGDFSKMTDADLSALELTRDQANELGLQESLLRTPANLQRVYDQNPAQPQFANIRQAFMQQLMDQFGGVNFDQSRYATPIAPSVGINPANFASIDDYQKAAALSQLTGEDLSSFLNPANVGQAGTAPRELISYDYPGAKTDASTAYQQILRGLGGTPAAWDELFRSIHQSANAPKPTGGITSSSVKDADALVAQSLALRQQGGGTLTPEEQAFIDYFRNRGASLGGRGVTAL